MEAMAINKGELKKVIWLDLGLLNLGLLS